jgi:hypothetical protein
MALYLAGAKGTPPPREPEAHPTAAWVQVPWIGICGAGRCVSRATGRICATGSGTVLTWVFNVFGMADLLFAFYQGSRISLPDTQGLLGAGYFILTAYVPLLLITHGLVFRMLVRTRVVASCYKSVTELLARRRKFVFQNPHV